jgi:ribonuclease Z
MHLMNVSVLGCGEAFDERLPNTSLLLQGPAAILCDCGYSIPPVAWRTLAADDVDIVYISHAHADHYFGLPALLGRWWEDGRTKPLTILSQPAVLDQIRDVIEYGYRALSRRFAYEITYAPANECEMGGVHFSFAPTLHSVTNFAVRMEADGIAVCYSGDGMFTDESRSLFTGADLLVHEAYSFEESPVHGDIPRVIAMAAEKQVKRLALTHIQRGLRAAPNRIFEAMRNAGDWVSLPGPGDRIDL